MSTVQVRPLTPEDWPSVRDIYAEGIATGDATFEEHPPDWEAFDAAKIPDPRLVATDDEGSVVGWAAASAVSAREVYRGVVEHSIYIAPVARGSGVGHALLASFVDAAERAGLWTIQSSVFAENAASLALHAAHGFRVVGTRQRIGLMTYGPHRGQWRDTILIERRSA